MDENSKKHTEEYYILLKYSRGIDSPYEYGYFGYLLEHNKNKLRDYEYDELVKVWHSRKGVLLQLKYRFNDIIRIDVLPCGEVFSVPKRHTTYAEQITHAVKEGAYQSEADREGLSLYDYLMKKFEKYDDFVVFYGSMAPAYYREAMKKATPKQEQQKLPVSPPPSQQEIPKEQKKEEIQVVAIPPEVMNTINSMYEKVEETQQKFTDEIKELVSEIERLKNEIQALKSNPQQTRAETKITRKRQAVPIPDYVKNLFEQYIGRYLKKPVKGALLNSYYYAFMKFLNQIKEYYPNVWGEAWGDVLDYADFKPAINAVENRKSLLEALDEVLKDLKKNLPSKQNIEEMAERSEYIEEENEEKFYKLKFMADDLIDTIELYESSKESGNKADEERALWVLQTKYLVLSDKDLEEAKNNPEEYILKKKLI